MAQVTRHVDAVRRVPRQPHNAASPTLPLVFHLSGIVRQANTCIAAQLTVMRGGGRERAMFSRHEPPRDRPETPVTAPDGAETSHFPLTVHHCWLRRHIDATLIRSPDATPIATAHDGAECKA